MMRRILWNRYKLLYMRQQWSNKLHEGTHRSTDFDPNIVSNVCSCTAIFRIKLIKCVFNQLLLDWLLKTINIVLFFYCFKHFDALIGIKFWGKTEKWFIWITTRWNELCQLIGSICFHRTTKSNFGRIFDSFKKLILSINWSSNKRAKLQTVHCACGWLQAASKLMELFSSFRKRERKRKGKQISRGQNYIVRTYDIASLLPVIVFFAYSLFILQFSDSVLKSFRKINNEKSTRRLLLLMCWNATWEHMFLYTYTLYGETAMLYWNLLLCIETVISNFAFDSHQLFNISSNKQWRMNKTTDRYFPK